MKNCKTIVTLIGVATALSLAILPLGAWSTAKAEEPNAETPAISYDYGIKPLFGGSDSYTFNINGYEVKVDVAADNWVFPAIDQAVINISSDSIDTYYGFKLKFVWTKKGCETTWLNPGQYDPVKKAPLKLLESKNGLCKEHIEKNCDGKDVKGTKGVVWSCNHIYLSFSCRVGNSSIYTHEFGPIYF